MCPHRDADPFAETAQRRGPPMVVAAMSAVAPSLAMGISRVPMSRIRCAAHRRHPDAARSRCPHPHRGARCPGTPLSADEGPRRRDRADRAPARLAALGGRGPAHRARHRDPRCWALPRERREDRERSDPLAEPIVGLGGQHPSAGVGRGPRDHARGVVETRGPSSDGTFTDELAASVQTFVNHDLAAEPALHQAARLVTTGSALIEIPGPTTGAPTGTALLKTYTVAAPDIRRGSSARTATPPRCWSAGPMILWHSAISRPGPSGRRSRGARAWCSPSHFFPTERTR